MMVARFYRSITGAALALDLRPHLARLVGFVGAQALEGHHKFAQVFDRRLSRPRGRRMAFGVAKQCASALASEIGAGPIEAVLVLADRDADVRTDERFESQSYVVERGASGSGARGGGGRRAFSSF